MQINQSEHVIKQQAERIRELEEKYLKAQYENEGLMKQVDGMRNCDNCKHRTYVHQMFDCGLADKCETLKYEHWQPRNKG